MQGKGTIIADTLCKEFLRAGDHQCLVPQAGSLYSLLQHAARSTQSGCAADGKVRALSCHIKAADSVGNCQPGKLYIFSLSS